MVIELFQVPVSSFKEKIANEIGIPVGQQRLIFRGRVLKDDHLLTEYRIQSLFFLCVCVFVIIRCNISC